MNKYHAEHTWVRIEGDTALVGITQHAQDTLGDIVFVDFAPVGTTAAQGTVAGVVESVKAAADVHMPATVEILEHNEALRADPSLANSDPEGAGWFYKVKLNNAAELDGLMDDAAYQGITG
ncbi:glycine cleavage system H protein [Limnohabitans sp. MORI2]|uniref:glycine cleavage system protein GcvH n=1 Tax=Limnohabitans sp. MORI2 TaxID=1751150 RepID=UPI002377B1CB|nr:glycine cleavage system protein GcvH [Limnohabitans sp. MORI2]BDU58657.1 glycine cleavage system H protein [Limnohabitans sp. MORI2]